MMLRDYVVDEGYHGIEAEQHEQPFAYEDGQRSVARKEAPHDRTVYTLETRL